MRLRQFAALAWLALAGCGGKDGTLTLSIVVSPVDDPFTDAATVRFTIGDASHVKTFPVTGGHFDATIELSPISTAGPVIVDALDAGGNLVAHGQTPQLSLDAVDQGPIAVWVGRPGKLAAAPAALPKPIAEFASVSSTGLGILYAGGRGADGVPLADTNVYDVFTHAIVNTTPLTTARAGALATNALSIQAVVFGGSTATGVGAAGMPLATGELFDPTVGLGLWSALPASMVDARSQANVIIQASGTALITGGADTNGAPVGSGALITTTGTVALSAIATAMSAPRLATPSPT